MSGIIIDWGTDAYPGTTTTVPEASGYVSQREGIEVSPEAMFNWIKSGISNALTLGDTDFAQRLETILTWAVIIGVGYLLVQLVFLGKAWKEVLSP